ncbi:unnamed protein product [Durusdinium trenchii]|uniref:Uncharacterized protein n=1 Tax=Durusdinium trenchii TaxID=1381693 RepID=A0ABP0LYS5_9DINO
MKVSAHRAFDTGDDTDYVLSQDTPYYILLTVGQTMGTTSAIQVGYHGSASTQTLVCLSTLSQKGWVGACRRFCVISVHVLCECKLASEWSGPPALNDSSLSVALSLSWPFLAMLAQLF